MTHGYDEFYILGKQQCQLRYFEAWDLENWLPPWKVEEVSWREDNIPGRNSSAVRTQII